MVPKRQNVLKMDTNKKAKSEGLELIPFQITKASKPPVSETGKITIEELFWDFLYQADCHDNEAMYKKMFNVSFELQDILKQCHPYIEEQYDEYMRSVFRNRVTLEGIEYIHARDLGTEGSLERAAVNRRFLDLPDHVKKVISSCARKCKGKCRLIEKDVGFLCFLHNLTLAYGDNKEEELHEDITHVMAEDDPMKENEDEEELEEGEELDLNEEKKIVDELDLETIRYSSIIKERVVIDAEISDLAVPCLPTFQIDGYTYVLLFDIQCMFQLREDEALALLTQKWKDETTWVENNHVFGELDLCFEHKEGISLVLNEAKQYEPSIPGKEEFNKLQEHIPVPIWPCSKTKESQDSMLKMKKPIEEDIEDYHATKGGKSINLWSDKYLEKDENFELEIEADNFLCGSGSNRERGWAKNSGLRNYLSNLKYPEVLIIHNKFSRNGYIPLFAFKTLSKFLGSYDLPQSQSKVILLEMKSAIEAFGFAPRLMGSFKGYYLSYGATALSMGIRDPTKLAPYGKHYMLRHRRYMELQHRVAGTKELEQKNVQEESKSNKTREE